MWKGQIMFTLVLILALSWFEAVSVLPWAFLAVLAHMCNPWGPWLLGVHLYG